mmetsp:Transcript_4267/g.8735  ORF Transcript_4267/g.8735 Transcript_4267/m.8735 type:complete len:599 (+) Transcript_4267:101-1897(+)
MFSFLRRKESKNTVGEEHRRLVATTSTAVKEEGVEDESLMTMTTNHPKTHIQRRTPSLDTSIERFVLQAILVDTNNDNSNDDNHHALTTVDEDLILLRVVPGIIPSPSSITTTNNNSEGNNGDILTTTPRHERNESNASTEISNLSTGGGTAVRTLRTDGTVLPLSSRDDDDDNDESQEDDDDDDVEASTNPFRRSSSGQTSDHTQIENWYNVMQEVHANAQSSIDVLNDLLNYDKVESGTLALELTIIPMRQLIEQTVQEFNLPAAQKQMELNVSFSSELSPQSNSNDTDMVGDVVRLTQVLRNLISNAIKFTPRGGSLDIRATTTRATPQERQMAHKFTLKNMMTVSRVRSGTLQLEVQDSGAGMTKAQVSRLFRRGVQFNVNDLQAGQGSGLGLYIAKGIIEQHGGSLTASSQGLGHGSTFVVTLPLHQPTEGSTDTPSSAPPSESSETESTNNHQQQHDKPTAPWNVLVVDDSVSNRRLLSRLLQNRGHVCDEAENGQLALDKIRHAQEAGLPDYDLILLDSEMPVLNGPLTAQTIRKYDGYGKVLIVGITGNILPEDVHYFESCGANRVLGKPIRIDVLEEICREYYCTTMGP